MMNIKLTHFILALIIILGIFAIAFQMGQSSGEINTDEPINFQRSSNDKSVSVISWHPRIFYATKILTPEECDHIIKIGIFYNQYLFNFFYTNI